MLKQVRVEELEHEAVVIPKVTLVNHPNDVVLVIRVFLHDVFQVLSFLMSELVVHFCVSGDLHRY